MEHIAIIGNGISGITAARHIRKLSHKKITVISSETDYFFSRTALMYVYMGHMKFEHTQPYEPHFWEKNNIQLKQAKVTEIDSNEKTLRLDNGETVEEILLDKPDKGLYIKNLIWREMFEFSDDSVLMVVASELYNEDDYIKDYDHFLKISKENS